MFKNLTIKAKLLGIVISSIILITIVMTVETVISLNNTSKMVIDDFRKDAFKSKEEEIKNYVSLATKTVESYYKRTSKNKVKEEVSSYLTEQTNYMFSIIENEYEKNKNILSNEELKVKIKSILAGARFGKSGYFFVYDQTGVNISLPPKKHLEGKNLSHIKDVNGVYVIKELIAFSKSKSTDGVLEYLWTKPGFEKPQAKVSYSKLFKPFNWIVGTGSYLDDVSAKLKEEAKIALSLMKYGNKSNGYYWVNDSNHILVMHGAKASLAGTNMNNVQDAKGKYLYREIVKTANASKDGGFVSYFWERPDTKKPLPKLSYVKKFEQWDWIIGTGTYVDDIYARVAFMKERTENEIKEKIITNILIIVALLVFISFFMYYYTNKIIFKPLQNFQEGLLGFFKYLNKENKDVQNLEVLSKDEIGYMSNIINDNIHKTQSLIKEDEALINNVKSVVEEVKNGYLTSRVNISTQNVALSELKIIFNEMLSNVQKNVDGDINKITKVLDTYKSMDFTTKIENPDGKVSQGLNELSDIINNLLNSNLRNGTVLEENASNLSSNVTSLSESSNIQAASLEETAAALEEITSTVISTTENITNMEMYSKKLATSIEAGQKLANSTVESMNEINAQTQSIADAITVIDQIAFQTNILSLNAAVEAATAGEAGKGFAVVAQEVRNLASRSADAAKEIKELVESATDKTNQGKQIADKMISGYDELNVNIINSTETIGDIARASKEQQAGIEQINDAITALDQGTQENASVASHTARIANSTSDMAKAMVEETNKSNFIGKGTKYKADSLDKNKNRKNSIDMDYRRKEKRAIESSLKTGTANKSTYKNTSEVFKSTQNGETWESF